MYIKYLKLSNYRNYKELNIELGNKVNVFMGDNAQGKTNVLEAIYYCGFAKSHRTNKDKELINWNEDRANITLYVAKERLDKKIDISILRDGKKGIKINSIKINKISELVGTFNVVMFSPEDLKIVKESPGIRRRFLDMELCQLDNRYYYNLVQYNKVLQERNTALKSKNIDESMIDIYDIQLSKFGQYIIKKRVNYIERLSYYGKIIHKDITSNKEEISFEYLSNVKNMQNAEGEIREGLYERRKKDMEKGNTSLGPHRDDLAIYINNIDARSFGSQGQQRTSVLTMKFASLRIINEWAGDNPVLLLDDVLSELDFSRKKYILSSIKDIQTIITCTGIEDIRGYLNDDAKIFNVSSGRINI